jgi:hypothetical protein
MKAALLVLIGAILASGVWYWYSPHIDQAFWMKHTLAQQYQAQVKEDLKELRQGNTAQAIQDFNNHSLVNQTLQAQVGHPEYTNCRGMPGKDKLGRNILIIEPCPSPMTPAIYWNAKEAVIHVQLLTYTDELPLDIDPTLIASPSQPSTLVPLGNRRFRVSGMIMDEEKILAGYKILVVIE